MQPLQHFAHAGGRVDRAFFVFDIIIGVVTLGSTDFTRPR
jgi:hypothetical protein